ncbi:MAG: sugar ABC transporter substrate-binding protein, partial [Victivallales bacterium]|nr:sugar ABC transporter substrate-binding protein [Victivallales bacterium]
KRKTENLIRLHNCRDYLKTKNAGSRFKRPPNKPPALPEVIDWYKLTFFLGFGLLVFVLLVYDNPETKHDGKIELRILSCPPPGYGNKFEETLQEFEKLHPDIRVKLIKAPGNYYVKVQTMMVGKTCADVVGFTGKRVNAFKIKGTLLNLMPFVKRDNYDLDDYFKVGLEDAQMTKNELYYLPTEGSGTVLFYNKNIFDRAKLKYPDANWTWNDFRDAAVKVTQDIDGDGRIDQIGCCVTYWWAEMLPWVWANGGRLVNRSQTKCLLNRPEAVEALTFLIDLERKYHVTAKALGGTESAGIYENFASGHIGMVVCLAYALPNLMDACKNSPIRWNIAMPPKGKYSRPIRYTSSGWVIWRGSKHPKEAWELIKFLNSREVMKDYCFSNYYVPARQSIGLSKEFLNRADTPYDENILIQSLLESRPLDNIYALRSIESDFGIAVGKARLGLSDLQTEIDKVTAQADAALKEYSSKKRKQ